MDEFMLIKTTSMADAYVLEFVGMFATEQEAKKHVEYQDSYYLIPAKQLFWQVSEAAGLNQIGVDEL